MTLQELLGFWSFLFLGVLVYSMGQGVKRVFPTLAQHPWYQRTVVMHAPLVATLIAALPAFPMPEALGVELGTRLLYGAVAGITSAWSYKAVSRLLGRDTKSRSET